MEGMGAELDPDGKWQFNGKPVTLIFMIRPDGDGTRKPMGDYFANQLETVGFTVDRQYKTSSEAFPIWLGTAGADGQWQFIHRLYPGGFRDERGGLQQGT
jgi:peptide/nickel transport system substrate-binding protein